MTGDNIKPGHSADVYELRPGLKGGGGGGTFDGMELMDAKIAASEARTDTKFAEVLGELRSMRAQTSHLPTTGAMIATVIASTAAAVSLIVGVLALGGDRFDGGVSVGQAGVEAKIALDRVINENEAQSRQIEQVSQQLQKVLFAISNDPATQQSPNPAMQMPLITPGQ